jgi:predicted transposase/invertase (TIGR01784 family)
VLLGQRVQIVEILESEGNQDSDEDKYNRVDVKAKNDLGEIFIVEVQLTRQLYYLERILYGVAKTLTEHIKLGNLYNEVKKVYHISIVYFDLGQGADYLYHGQTKFIGVHTHDELKVNTKEEQVIQMKTPSQVFPEYYIIRVNEFNDVARTPLEEWLDYLKNGYIREDTTAPGLYEAKEKLKVMTMSQSDRQAYDRHLDAIMVQEDVLTTAKKEGLAEGRAEGLIKGREEGRKEGQAEGREEGRAEANLENARKMKALGMTDELIVQITGLSSQELKNL